MCKVISHDFLRSYVFDTVFYYQSYGIPSNGFASALSYNAFASGNAWEAYDKADVIFKEGRAASWKGYVQR